MSITLKSPVWVIVVTDSDTGKRREVRFTNETSALGFKRMAEEDGSYWGIYTAWEERPEQPTIYSNL